jgi:hypothetical protein
MCADVVLARDGAGYRVVFGYLRLAAVMSSSNELLVDVKGDGTALVLKTPDGLLVNKDNHQLPLLKS